MTQEVPILRDESGFVIVNKPSGMLSEGGGARESDLEQVVSDVIGRKVFCCHRLDRLTSGVVVLRKGRQFAKALSDQFERGRIRKEYWLLVDGEWSKNFNKVVTRIGPLGKGVWANVTDGGKEAVSTFRRIGFDSDRNVSLVSGLLKTGRTHQMRLHALEGNCPVIGDPLYGVERSDGFFGLHARTLRMTNPDTGDSIDITAETPDSWSPWLERFD